MERCYAFGQALARIVSAMGVKYGGVGERRNVSLPRDSTLCRARPSWDRDALARIATGNLKSLVGYGETELDAAGNVELRCWACAAGALGERKPNIVSLEPS